jgi:UDP-2,4-diacetamido-2,4,6-trideoxy-beta-L-altropyranose hydrolase
MKVAFRVDASLDIGTGHIMRCLTLSDALRERGGSCTFVCRPHQGHLIALISERGHQALALPELQEDTSPNCNGTAHAQWLGTNWATDAKESQIALSVQTGGKSLDWLVVDHYALDARWEEALRPQAKRLMVIDDLANRLHACDLLLDQNFGRQEKDYVGLLRGKPPTTLVGPHYALLRADFAKLRKQSLARRKNNTQLRHLLITMGGVDKDNATGRILATLKSCNLEGNLRITVVMGPHAPWLDEVQAQAAQMPWPVQVLVGVNNMAQIMAESDLAIGAAGVTAWERCSLGLPSLLLVLAENQFPGAVALQKVGAAVVVETQEQIKSALKLMISAESTKEFLVKLSQAAAAITDGKGCQRIVKHMLEGMSV